MRGIGISPEWRLRRRKADVDSRLILNFFTAVMNITMHVSKNHALNEIKINSECVYPYRPNMHFEDYRTGGRRLLRQIILTVM